jgi:hypothetical protein
MERRETSPGDSVNKGMKMRHRAFCMVREQVSTLTFTSCVTLGKLLALPGPPLSYCKSEAVEEPCSRTVVKVME